MKSKIITMVIIAGVLFGCSEENTATQTNNTVTVNNEPTKDTTSPADAQPKTDAEIALEAIKLAVDVGQDIFDNKRRNDSIKEVHKEKMYAYQIGLEKTDKDEVFDTYKKLMDLGISNLYVLKKSRKDFIIVRYEAKAQEELNQALDAFKTQIASVESSVGITNLMQICGASEIIKDGGKLKERKVDFEIPCLICD
ncbi:MAG: hypothetical protein ACXVC6_01580 [Bacteroidia bacterium]